MASASASGRWAGSAKGPAEGAAAPGVLSSSSRGVSTGRGAAAAAVMRASETIVMRIPDVVIGVLPFLAPDSAEPAGGPAQAACHEGATAFAGSADRPPGCAGNT